MEREKIEEERDPKTDLEEVHGSINDRLELLFAYSVLGFHRGLKEDGLSSVVLVDRLLGADGSLPVCTQPPGTGKKTPVEPKQKR